MDSDDLYAYDGSVSDLWPGARPTREVYCYTGDLSGSTKATLSLNPRKPLYAAYAEGMLPKDHTKRLFEAAPMQSENKTIYNTNLIAFKVPPTTPAPQTGHTVLCRCGADRTRGRPLVVRPPCGTTQTQRGREQAAVLFSRFGWQTASDQPAHVETLGAMIP